MNIHPAIPALLLLVAPALGQNARRDKTPPIPQPIPAEVVQATESLRAGMPAMAARQMEAWRAKIPARQRSAESDWIYAESLLHSGQAAKALEVLLARKDPSASNPRTVFLKAECLRDLGRNGEAEMAYRTLFADPDFGPRARSGAALALRASGRNPEALEALGDLTDADATMIRCDLLLDTGRVGDARALIGTIPPGSGSAGLHLRYLEGKIALAEGAHDTAMQSFRAVLNAGQGLDLRLLSGATLGYAEACLKADQPEDAEDILVKFIERMSMDQLLAPAFSQYERVLTAQDGSSDEILKKWRDETPLETRRNLAILTLARLRFHQKRTADAIKLLQDWPDPATVHTTRAMLQLAEWLLDQKRPQEALAAIAKGRAADHTTAARLDLLEGRARFDTGDYPAARAAFIKAAKDPALAEDARFDAALTRLAAGDSAGYLEDYKEFSAAYPESPRRRELLLEEGMLRARQREPAAQETLQRFTRDFPNHPRKADAFVALAELAGMAGNTAAAKVLLKEAADASPQPATRERIEYFSIQLMEDDPDVPIDLTAKAAQKFLADHPGSPLRFDALMKLGELYYSMEDFPAARTQFETAAEEYPARAETPLFLAARAALKSRAPDAINAAIERFERVYRMEGSLKLRARLEQAQLKARLEQYTEALVLYDSVLNAAPPTDLLVETRIAKGETLFAIGLTDPSKLPLASAMFAEAAETPDAGAYWTNQALWKKGQALEKIGSPSEALLAYNAVLLTLANGKSTEHFWFYKAGFDAARLLEAEAQWQSAAALYERLSDTGGPRATEAAARRDRLRLEQFLWVDEKVPTTRSGGQ